ncbi:MAG: HisA/HisF-related TIM barrel protein, partial [Flavobacteriaceae bacterium]
ISTDITVDGMLTGPSVELYSELINEFGSDLHLIASGGIKDLSDLEQLKEIGCSGAILGKAIYENRITLKELENFILND